MQKIKTFWLALNYKCNNRCRGCYAAKSGFVDMPMRLEDAFQIVEMMSEVGAKDGLLIGGEPTLYENLVEIIQYGRAHNIEMKLVTNGRKLSDTDYLQKLVEAGLKHSSVSIEGANESTHNCVTATQSYYEVLRAIKNCRDLGVSFNTLLTINRRNYLEVIPLAELLHDLGVTNILYNIGLPSCGKDSEPDEEYLLNPAEVAAVIENAYLILKAKGIKVKFFATVPLCLIKEEVLSSMLRDDYISDGVHCHIYYGTGVVFEPNGNVLPCTHFVNHPLFNLKENGITKSKDFADKWYGEKGIHGSFRKALWNYPHENCRGCKHWGKCIGGCPFLWLQFDPREIFSMKGGDKICQKLKC